MKTQLAIGVMLALCGIATASKMYAPLNVESFASLNFTQQLDHFNAKDRTNFTQRYWRNDQYWNNKSGPIFLYICGESTCKPPSERGFPFQVCQDLGCLFYVLEHRYYGASQPFADWSVPNLKYLNSTQALADLDYFIKNQTADINTEYGAGVRKWLTIGGSYPGALSAWFKSQYPNSAAAAWSSSGVIHAIQDYAMYDYDLYQSALRSSPSCPSVIKSINDYVESAINGTLPETEKEYVYSVFGGSELPNNDFMSFIADAVAGAIQYGGREKMCNIFDTIADAAPKYQIPVFKQWAVLSGSDISTYPRSVLQNITYDINKNGRQWMWQVCTEFGWFQVPNSVFPMRSDLLGPDYWIQYCKDIFADNVGPPDVAYYNKLYGGLDIKGTNIVYANAIEDPWQYAGMREIHNPATQSEMETVLINCNNCAHCIDLRTPTSMDAPTLTNARNKIKQQVTKWLTPTPAELEEAFGKPNQEVQI